MAAIIAYQKSLEGNVLDRSFDNTASVDIDQQRLLAEFSRKAMQIRQHGGKLYKCLQDHLSQKDWQPDHAPSLWVAISDPAEEWPAWSQPIGAQDAYAQGAKVSHSGKHWLSTAANNVWEPGVYGWEEAAGDA